MDALNFEFVPRLVAIVRCISQTSGCKGPPGQGKGVESGTTFKLADFNIPPFPFCAIADTARFISSLWLPSTWSLTDEISSILSECEYLKIAPVGVVFFKRKRLIANWSFDRSYRRIVKVWWSWNLTNSIPRLRLFEC